MEWKVVPVHIPRKGLVTSAAKCKPKGIYIYAMVDEIKAMLMQADFRM